MKAELVGYQADLEWRTFELKLDRCPICKLGERSVTDAAMVEALRGATKSVDAEYVLEHLELQSVEHIDEYRGDCVWDIYFTVNVSRVRSDAEYDRADEHWANR